MQEPVELSRDQGPASAAGLERTGALEALRQAALGAPGDAQAQYDLGAALAGRGLGRDAVAVLQQAIRLQPDHMQALVLLGRLLIELGNPAAGKAALKTALQRSPQTHARLFNLGNLMRQAGCDTEALAAFDAAIRVGPETGSAHYNRGVCLRALGRLDSAAAAYQRAVEFAPAHKKAHNNLGNCLRHLGRYAGAERALRRAIELDPDWFAPHYNLGRVLNKVARHGEAVVAFRRALRLNPDHVEAHVRLGVVLQEIGQLEAAKASYHRALALQPDYAPAHGYLAQIDGEPLTPDALDRLESQLASGKGPATDRQHLHFALAQRYDQVGAFGPAFDHLVAGNRLKRAEMRYDVEIDLRRFAAIARAFDRELFLRRAPSGDPSPLPVFVVGMPRSGTTLIEQILASHSQVHGAGEIADLTSIATRTLKAAIAKQGGAAEQVLAPAALLELGQTYLRQLRVRAPHAPRIVDKMLTNFVYVGLIKLMLPNAHVIHARRHPLDTCLSIFRKLFAAGLAFSYDLTELGRYYVGYARLMRHWHEVLPGYVLDVQYEEMIGDQRGTTERILTHCGLDWQDACLEFHQTQRTVRTASVAQVRQPIYRSSAGAWKRYGERLRPLIDALGDELDVNDLADLGDGTS